MSRLLLVVVYASAWGLVVSAFLLSPEAASLAALGLALGMLGEKAYEPRPRR